MAEVVEHVPIDEINFDDDCLDGNLLRGVGSLDAFDHDTIGHDVDAARAFDFEGLFQIETFLADERVEPVDEGHGSLRLRYGSNIHPNPEGVNDRSSGMTNGRCVLDSGQDDPLVRLDGMEVASSGTEILVTLFLPEAATEAHDVAEGIEAAAGGRRRPACEGGIDAAILPLGDHVAVQAEGVARGRGVAHGLGLTQNERGADFFFFDLAHVTCSVEVMRQIYSPSRILSSVYFHIIGDCY